MVQAGALGIEGSLKEERARVEEFEHRRQELQEQIAACVKRTDYKTAANLQEQMESLCKAGAKRMEASREEERARVEEFEHCRQRVEEQIKACVKEGDYKTAAALQEHLASQLKAAAPRVEASQVEERARAEELARDRQRLEEQIARCAQKNDYKTAAALQGELDSLLDAGAPGMEAGVERKQTRMEYAKHRQQELEERVVDSAKKGDYKTAAALKDQLELIPTTAAPR